MANAIKHYMYYPNDKNVPIYLAYGFRAVFLLLAPYIVISSFLWGFVYAGIIPFFSDDILTWHIYEFLYGIGIAGILAFLLTGLPEMYPGSIPLVGKKLKYIVILWFLGRVSFWFIDYLSIYFVAFVNIIVLVWLIYFVFKPVVLDKLQKHSSLAYTIIGILIVQVWFFLSQMNLVQTDSLSILKVALGLYLVLILLALRRVNMEALNEIIEDKNIDDIFLAKAFRYNLAVFTVLLYTAGEFFYPENQALAWVSFACACSILSILNDYFLKYESILLEPFVFYLASISISMSLGYAFIAYDLLDDSIYAINHFRHFLTTGAFGLAFFVIMVVISTVHTGRSLVSNRYIFLGVLCILFSTIIRVFIPYYIEFTMEAYIISSLLWACAFILYMIKYFPYLLKERADGIKG
ncbi:NnrS family protein [Malaciobacter sp. WC5094]